jgi:hypothetical protein
LSVWDSERTAKAVIARPAGNSPRAGLSIFRSKRRNVVKKEKESKKEMKKEEKKKHGKHGGKK